MVSPMHLTSLVSPLAQDDLTCYTYGTVERMDGSRMLWNIHRGWDGERARAYFELTTLATANPRGFL